VHSVDLQVLRQAATWLQNGRRVNLATIVRTFGSAPRPVGAMLAVNDCGKFGGSISGGCVEDDLINTLRAGDFSSSAPDNSLITSRRWL